MAACLACVAACRAAGLVPCACAAPLSKTDPLRETVPLSEADPLSETHGVKAITQAVKIDAPNLIDTFAENSFREKTLFREFTFLCKIAFFTNVTSSRSALTQQSTILPLLYESLGRKVQAAVQVYRLRSLTSRKNYAEVDLTESSRRNPATI
jgi:hypothetical protein